VTPQLSQSLSASRAECPLVDMGVSVPVLGASMILPLARSEPTNRSVLSILRGVLDYPSADA
jgi:hypothetical protein